MAYNILCCQNLTELATRRGNANPLIGTILGINYPLDEAFAVYEWKNTDTTTPDGYEVVASTSGDTTIGRWFRVENAVLPQVNSDWNATSGPAAILNKPVLLKGDKGDTGSQGIQGVQGIQGLTGTTGSKGDKGEQGLIGNTGSQGVQGNIGLQGIKGDKGDTGLQGTAGTAGVNSFSAPVSRTVSLATAYQATNPAKPSVITITLTATSSVSLSGVVNNVAALLIGATNGVATGTGTVVGGYENTLGGTLVVGLNLSNKATNTYTITLPTGWYFAVRQTTGTGVTVVSTFDQQVG